MNVRRKVILLLIAVIVCTIYMGTSWTQSSQCGRYPQKSDILIDNVNWQVLQIPIGFVYILNAYMDARFNQNTVKINVNAPVALNISTTKLFCQLWFDDGTMDSLVVEASHYQVIFVPGKFMKFRRHTIAATCLFATCYLPQVVTIDVNVQQVMSSTRV
jgi:hypothetical protein